jgi:rhodanese-related sulfurtransferase
MGWIVIIVLSVAVIPGIAILLYKSHSSGADISQSQLQEWMRLKSDLYILDVRSVDEYNSGHIPGAINIGHTEIPARLDELRPHSNKDIVVYCERGVRARIARKALKKAGFAAVYHLTGDMARWRDAGLPVDTTSTGLDSN